ncbi:MAG TPA: hypothetical protein VJ963_12230, partial [Bacteroidales bacterium]|nr:hypothetical protein [Bacteroidales bacterium]
VNKDFPSSSLLVFSGEKYERIMPTKNIISTSKRRTFGNSKIKNLRASVNLVPAGREKREPISQSVAG